MRNTALAICVCFLIQNQRYVRIASWDIRISVVIAPNLDLCRLHVAPFNSTGLTSLKSTGTCLFFVFTYPVDLCVFCRHIFCYIFVTSSLGQLV